MSLEVVYGIARFRSEADDAVLLGHFELLSAAGSLLLSEGNGSAKPCEGADVVSVISSTPSLREIRAGESTRISCAPEIAAKLPLVLKPVVDGNPVACTLEVNDVDWAVYPTLDDEYVVLPGQWSGDAPELSPCWAEYKVVEEGDWSRSGPLASSLIGCTLIGLATPSVVVEYASCGYDGLGSGEGRSAVAIRPFSDVVDVVVDWLVDGGSGVLGHIWEGNLAPCSPSVRLFAEAAAAADRSIRWNTDMGGDVMAEDDQDEEFLEVDDGDEDGGAGYVYVDDEEDGEDAGTSDWASVYLELHLSDAVIDRIRDRIASRK